MNNKILKTATGFTLLEIIIVLAIMAIAMTIAIPNVMSWLPDYRLKAAARDLYSNMQKAKSEALKRNCSVGITFSTVTFPTQGGGYTVFLDNGAGTNAGNAVQDPGEATLLTVAMPSGCTLYEAIFFSTSGNTPRTIYNSRGFPGNKTGHARLRNNNSVWYEMALSNSGYPKIRKSHDGTNWN
ncbi:GspH/FimT family pseudopilin [Desulfobacter postgatei]|jgi:type IV fimbrial biogenesis protein FimT|uniref:GspH/FimT family pseudopilin n=1 Tax=Desulfobacter postgatei TaxID=2293 RepID=UPI002A3698AF|nr:GspH/FimT family pseudopilin [Desulfobacter postgatei]MDX9964748.1 GspH/FimT family pseudopilin [Desulfobacter postgatei]